MYQNDGKNGKYGEREKQFMTCILFYLSDMFETWAWTWVCMAASGTGLPDCRIQHAQDTFPLSGFTYPKPWQSG